MTLRIGGLCTGYGGIETAVEQLLDAETVWHVENDPHASAVLRHHWPNVANHGDITSIDWDALPSVDVLCAGFPCQDISNAGKRKGIDGERSGIWRNVAEAVRILEPRYVFLENVSAIVRRGALLRVASDMAQIRYNIRWCCLRASDVGAPHRRDRWFGLCTPHADGIRWNGRSRSVTEPSGRHEPTHHGSAPALFNTPSLADGTGAHEVRGGTRSNELLLAGQACDVLPTPKASDDPHGGPNQRDSNGNYYLPGVAPRLDDQWVGSNGKDYGPAVRRWERIIGRRAPAPNEPGTRGGLRLHAPFAEWMMGIPEGHVTSPEIGLTRAQQLKRIGNGVVPQQAYAAYASLMSEGETR